MLTWTLTTSLFLPTSSMQSIPTGRGISCLNKPQAPQKSLISTYRAKKDISTYKIASQGKTLQKRGL